MEQWRKDARKAIEESSETEHAWFKFKEDNFECCAKCGIVKRKDGKNKQCPGKVKITFR